MSLVVAILGRPNVGKSTLFNRLIGRRLALVDDTPGVTRDRREGEGRIADLTFRVVDTAGLEEAASGSLAGRIQGQTERALADADVALLLIDAREGVTAADCHFADWLRRSGKPVVLLANKAEGRAVFPAIGEAYGLGLGDPVPVSAEHGEGLGELYDRLEPFSRQDKPAPSGPERPLQLAIVGRPNVGKSTLVNRMVGEERMLTGPEAGITRDAIAIDWIWKGRPLRLVDTAGLRRKPRVEGKLERLSVGDALRSIRFAEAVILVTDALQPLERQDLTIARLVEEEGRALVLAANKWDSVEEPGGAAETPARALGHIASAGSGRLCRAGFGADRFRSRCADDRRLGRRQGVEPAGRDRRPQPLAGGGPGAPSAAARCRPAAPATLRHPGEYPATHLRPVRVETNRTADSYRRYLVNALRRDFDLPGTPIRMMLRKGKNPYTS